MATQSHALPVLVTRPEPQASRFASQLRDAFGEKVHTVVSPLLAPVFMQTALPEGSFGAIILTSETGVTAAQRLMESGANLPSAAFCVGDRTAECAKSAGFKTLSAHADAAALAELVSRYREFGPFLHLRGRETRGDLLRLLHAQGIAARDIVVYGQDPVPLSAEAVQMLEQSGHVALPVFSPRSAVLLLAALESVSCKADLTIVAMSAAVAEVFTGSGKWRILTADKPEAAAMLTVLAEIVFKA